MEKIVLGRTYKDKLTGFQGVATAYVIYITGCNQACLQPLVKADGTFCEGRYVDEQRLEEVGGTFDVVLDNSKAPGFGDRPPVR